MATADKTRTIEAATGQLNEKETLQIGPWTIGYLSMKNSEIRRLESLEETKKIGDLLDFAYPIFLKRFIGENPPTQEEFEDETDINDLRVMMAWLNGMSEDEARRSVEGPTTTATAAAVH